MAWKSHNVPKEMLGRWCMVHTVEFGKPIWAPARCHRFEQDRDGNWWAEFRDLDGYNHPYRQRSVGKILELLDPIQNEKFQQYLDLFNSCG